MPGPADPERRRLLRATATAFAAVQLGIRPVASEVTPSMTRDPGNQPDSFGTLKQIRAGLLNVGYIEDGPPQGPVVLLIHGWPYDVHTYADVTRRLAGSGYRVIVPFLRGYGTTSFLDSATVRNGQQSALAVDMIELLDALRIKTAIVGGCDWGARSANIMAALWPERCTGLVSVSGYLIGNPATAGTPLPPEAEYLWWYQYYFATERGRAGYDQNREEFARLIWRLASPKWHFDEPTFQTTAAAFNNPDHVSIVIHNYRWRLGLAPGEARYDDLESRLATAPTIMVPTITLEGDANGAPHPEAKTYKEKFVGPYQHRVVTGGIGHNLPQEAPAAFAKAIVDVESSR